MRVIVPLVDAPERLIPLWPALTDAMLAVPGIEFVVVGSPEACNLMWRHPAVRRRIDVNLKALAGPFWSPARWRARAELRRAVADLDGAKVIDPFGDASLSGVVPNLPGQISGATGTDIHHHSAFPVPEDLHPVQRHRVLFAAVLDYSIHDLSPDYGVLEDVPTEPDEALVVDLLLDFDGSPWTHEAIEEARRRLSESGLAVYETDHNENTNVLWERVAQARYVLSGPNGTGWLAAAMGRHGLCLCETDEAVHQGVISTRRAEQKIINLDNESMSQPRVVIESIILVLNRSRPETQEAAPG